MKSAELLFDRPEGLEATAPAERRDAVRLLVSTPDGHTHATFGDLPRFLEPGDLLVVNESATLPASLHVETRLGPVMLNASTRFGPGLWLAEPRWGPGTPGPLPVRAGDTLRTCAGDVVLVARYPGAGRLWFVEGDLERAMARCGEPIRYGYVSGPQPLEAYQTIFARVPGSAEMPSAARPFTPAIVEALRDKGVGIETVRLHTGVSSLEVETEDVRDHPLPPEPFLVPPRTADAVNAARDEGRRVIAVGTTVVRSLESAWSAEEHKVRAVSGFTRLLVHPGRGVFAVDGLLTGLHDPGASHLAMLYAVAGKDLVREGYRHAVEGKYRWHEFGDSHLLLPV